MFFLNFPTNERKVDRVLNRGGIAAGEMRGERNGECDYIRNV